MVRLVHNCGFLLVRALLSDTFRDNFCDKRVTTVSDSLESIEGFKRIKLNR